LVKDLKDSKIIYDGSVGPLDAVYHLISATFPTQPIYGLQEVVHTSLHPPFGKNNILYFRSKASIFIGLDVLWISGSCPHPRSPQKSPSENCTFQPVILKTTEKSMDCFLPVRKPDDVFSDGPEIPAVSRRNPKIT
jgi:hypothetical protein